MVSSYCFNTKRIRVVLISCGFQHDRAQRIRKVQVLGHLNRCKMRPFQCCTSTSVCVYICMYIYICICMYIYIYMYVYIYVYVYIYIYLESPKTFFFCVFVFGLIFLRFCSKNAFLEMRTQKKVQSESSSGRVRHGRLKTPFGRKKTRFGRRKKVSGHCLRRI